MLTQLEVFRHLLDRGLVEPRSVVDGDLVLRAAASRNNNVRVERRRAPSYLVKQGMGPRGAASLVHEADVYRTLAALPEVSSFLPRVYDYEAERGVLVLELVGDGQDLRSYHVARRWFSRTLAARTGEVLGALHRHTASDTVGPPRPEWAPWVLSVHRPELAVLRDLSAATIQLVKIVQRDPVFVQQLDELRRGWRVEALIHNDVKWENFVVFAAPGSSRATKLKLVDWEAACPGDPCWDIGSLLSQYLSFWISSIPVTGETPPERFPDLARFPLDAMQPALRRCWGAYVHRAGFTPAAAGRRLERVVQLAAARLVQTAFEATQFSMQMTGANVLHLQLASNMLLRPREAASHLLGLPVGDLAA